MGRVGGGGISAVIWKDFIKRAHDDGGYNESLIKGDGLIKGLGSIWNGIINNFGDESDVKYEYPSNKN